MGSEWGMGGAMERWERYRGGMGELWGRYEGGIGEVWGRYRGGMIGEPDNCTDIVIEKNATTNKRRVHTFFS